MNFGNPFKKKPEARGCDTCNNQGFGLPFGAGAYLQSNRLKLSTVYRCVDLISSSIAQLPIVPYHVYKGNKRIAYEQAAYMLFKSPNRRMTTFTFIKLLISQMLLKGNGYALIKREKDGTPAELVYIPAEYVTIMTPTTYFEDIKYLIVGIDQIVEHTDIIHLINYTYDGYSGISTINYAADTLNLATYSEDHARTFFTSGANASGIVSVEGMVNDKQRNDIKKSWAETFHGNNRTGGVAVLGGNMKYESVQINPKDAQLLESRQFNVLDIARFFGVPATKLNSKEGATYNGIEAEQIAFLTDTIQPIIEKIEAEFERKLFAAKDRPFIDVKFDVTNLLRVDVKSKAEYYAKMFQLGVYSPNEIRQELGYEAIENGDNHFVQVNLMTLEQFSRDENTNKITANKANPGANDPEQGFH
jgi:HK97 family phage portal protein